MIKLLAVGMWVCLVALGASWAAAGFAGGETVATSTEEKEANFFAGLDYRNTNNITVPMIAPDGVKGYMLANFVYTIDGREAEALSVPPEPVILDAAFRRIYSTKGFDFDKPELYDIDALTQEIRTAVNERYGKELVHDVFVQQFDFLPKDMIRRVQAD